MPEYSESFLDDPWADIEGPIYPRVRRLFLSDERFWVSINEQNQRVFLIQESGLITMDHPNHLSGIDIEISPFSNNTRLLCTLTDDRLIDQFTLVAKDVAYYASDFGRTAIFPKALDRILSWSDFLKPSRKGLRLSERIGLWGELYILSEYLSQQHSVADAIRFWIGPDNKKQDFTLNHIALETKTTISGDSALIRISSAEQLEKITEKLYLIQLFINLSNANESISLKSLYEKIIDAIGDDLQTKTVFEHKISKIYGKATKEQQNEGFIFLHYNLYLVDDNFPKIDADDLPEGVLRVRYQIDSHKLTGWKINDPLERVVSE